MFRKQGAAALMKDGHSHFAGVEEAVLKNIEACKAISNITKTSVGPNGMRKMIIDHLEKTYVTSDTAIIQQTLEVEHPAAKMMVIAATAQEAECGDATNLVISLCGELLENAEYLLKQGIHQSEIVTGYELAFEKCMEYLKGMSCWSLNDKCSFAQLQIACKTSLSSKIYGYEEELSKLVAEACLMVMPKDPTKFNIDNVRIGKVAGGSFSDSTVIDGFCSARKMLSNITKGDEVKVAVYSHELQPPQAESKATVLLKTADELLNFSKSEEQAMENAIKAIADSGVKLIVAGSSVSEMALHFINKFDLMLLRTPSKFEIRRICRACGATALSSMSPPMPEEQGFFKSVMCREICSHWVTIMHSPDSKVATIQLRSGAKAQLEEMERAIHDAVGCLNAACKDGRYVAGAGATEIALSLQLQKFASTRKGLDQYSIQKFAEAIEIMPKMLAKSSGQTVIHSMASLYKAHSEGNAHAGVNVEGKDADSVINASDAKILDHQQSKIWAISHAVEAALTVLRIDQIIMSKQARGAPQ